MASLLPNCLHTVYDEPAHQHRTSSLQLKEIVLIILTWSLYHPCQGPQQVLAWWPTLPCETPGHHKAEARLKYFQISSTVTNLRVVGGLEEWIFWIVAHISFLPFPVEAKHKHKAVDVFNKLFHGCHLILLYLLLSFAQIAKTSFHSLHTLTNTKYQVT